MNTKNNITPSTPINDKDMVIMPSSSFLLIPLIPFFTCFSTSSTES
ncbi:hypothetical protein [Mucilaginibacter humi]|nr:hypothetical protein [Mucilaginibacter humi]